MDSILLIGGGNMGMALAARWRDSFAGTKLAIVETNAERRAQLSAQGFTAYASIDEVREAPSLIVLAVKPQVFPSIADTIRPLAANATLVSIMAGVPLKQLQAISPHAARVMPNTPAMIGEGMNAICAPGLSEERLDEVRTLFGTTGHVIVIGDEALMHAVTAISGSGPAYVFAFMESMEAAALSMGLDATTARALVMQTVRGAALLADQSGGDAARLRQQVTSPGGTTEAALKQFAAGGLDGLVKKAAEAALTRSKELSA